MNQPLLDHATRAMAVGSKSFDTAAKLFDADTRRSALMLYAWCRHCDDVIDDQEMGFNTGVASQTAAQQRLTVLKEQTRQAYAGEPMETPAFAAFQEVALKHAIPPRRAFEHLEGFAMDVREERYVTFEDTLRYCYHVAGVVGLMMAQVMGVRDDKVLDRACDLGLAFQLTNIARDIVEDARVGRCYLPESWLAEEQLSITTLADPSYRPRLARLAGRLINEAEPYYASAQAGLSGLPLRSAWAIATAHGVYRKIGLKVERAGANAWDQRQSTSRQEKVALLTKGSALALSSRVATPVPRPPGLWQRPA
ncbi:15-cis-phytoene synthase CrtB [Vreelandella populi]|uniref:Phytoene/squalene synthase family protein n=1 Tax=Vreelandella populi TaxID=2498858 RepID=A0A433L8Y9_9GAMM|nr:15-cis-phytoene synthase CrtB [Halomonas populi]RUR36942.1 phytoene/squalene synthase family protein [Halomonas populi]RUR44087.1 phytoene/squalene synthase family protein [Halomonas populi]RUR53544.1 phytoene/squalene synthase family protein [Halomonas populi]